MFSIQSSYKDTILSRLLLNKYHLFYTNHRIYNNKNVQYICFKCIKYLNFNIFFINFQPRKRSEPLGQPFYRVYLQSQTKYTLLRIPI